MTAFADAPASIPALPPIPPRFSGTPLLHIWRPADYNAAPANWSVLFDPGSGFVYVANDAGVLEFDGVSWRLIELPERGPARSLLLDTSGRLWVGGHNMLCRLEPDARGTLRSVPMLNAVAAGRLSPGNFSYLATDRDGVVARSTSGPVVAFDRRDRLTQWTIDRQEGYVMNLRDDRFPDAAIILQVMANGTRPLLPRSQSDGREPGPHLVGYVARLEADGHWFALTSSGPAHWSGFNRAVEFSPDNPFGAGHRPATAGAFLPDGLLAFGTESEGVLILDPAGRIVQRIDRRHGLPTDRIEHLAVDAAGGLWAALPNGIARLDFNLPIACHGAAQGVTASPRHLMLFGDHLYLAHGQGVSRRDEASGKFIPVDGFNVEAVRLLGVGERLLAATDGLREIMPDDTSRGRSSEVTGPIVTDPSRPGAVIAGGPGGLWRLERKPDGSWRATARLPEIDQGIDELVVAAGAVWAAGRLGAVFRLDFSAPDGSTISVRRFSPGDGVPPFSRRFPAHLTKIGADLLLVSPGGMRRFSPKAQRFVPEPRLAELGLSKDNGVEAVCVADPDRFWLLSSLPQRRLFEVRIAGDGVWHGTELAAVSAVLQAVTVEGLFEEQPTHTLWLSGSEGLFSVDLALVAGGGPAGPKPVVRMRQARSLRDGRVLFDGAGVALPAQLTPRETSLRLEFAAPDFSADLLGHNRVLYRTRLDDLEDDWSPWQATPFREYASLPAGRLRFNVQARYADGRESAPAIFELERLPPWWATLWARSVGGLLAAGLVAGIVRLRTRALRRHAAHLESLVAVRTAELERLRRLEMDEKITARLAEEKARLEVLRYQLNPHFLFNSLNSIYTLVWSHSRPAGDLVRRLAEFCRMTLTRRSAELATVAEEFAMLRAYLDLEQSRWKEHLQVEISLAPELETMRLPPFLLLPLVENAVKYGGHTSPDLLQIRVMARSETERRFVVEIANTGTWVEPGSAAEVSSTNIGLENLRRRLAQHFPGQHEFTTEARDGWVIARLRLPRAQSGPNPDDAGKDREER